MAYEALEYARENLPDGWTLEIGVSEGIGWASLIDPNGNGVAEGDIETWGGWDSLIRDVIQDAWEDE